MIGLHLLLDGVMLNPVGSDTVDGVLRELPSRIGMRIIAGPVVVEGDPSNPGWTGFVVIDKSHISIHTFTEGSRISVDVYSCQPFEAGEVRAYLTQRLGLTKISERLLTRSEA
jgi:S-adenosylmethionine decarboxylase